MIRSSVQPYLRVGYSDIDGIAWSVTDAVYWAEDGVWVIQSKRDDGSGVSHFTRARDMHMDVKRLARGNFVTTQPRRRGAKTDGRVRRTKEQR